MNINFETITKVIQDWSDFTSMLNYKTNEIDLNWDFKTNKLWINKDNIKNDIEIVKHNYFDYNIALINSNIISQLYWLKSFESEFIHVYMIENELSAFSSQKLKEMVKDNLNALISLDITYELYNYFENEIWWTCFYLIEPIFLLKEIYFLVRDKKYDDIINYENFVFWIDLKDNKKLQKKISNIIKEDYKKKNV